VRLIGYLKRNHLQQLTFATAIMTAWPPTARHEHYTVGSRFATVCFTTIRFLRPLSSRTEHSRLVVRHCRNSSVLSILVHFF